MKWNKEEYIISWGYFKKYGTNFGTSKNKEYPKYLELFRQQQNREYSNAFSTFKVKLMNYKAYETGDIKSDGGLSRNQYFKETIIDDEDNILEIFDNLTKNIETIEWEDNNLVKGVSAKNGKDAYDISIEDKSIYAKEANVEYITLTLKKYLWEVKRGKFKVPLFQREFVWSKQMIISFLNSLNKGFPFGTITVWNDKDNVFSALRNEYVQAFVDKNIISEETSWLLDGQQRTTSIVSQLVNNISGKNKHKGIIFSLSTNEFKAKDSLDINYIHATDLLDEEKNMGYLTKKYGIKKLNVANEIIKIRDGILDSKIGITVVKNSTLNTAIDIFTEMNTTGKKLSLFDIVNAKWQTTAIHYDLENYINKWKSKEGRIYKPDELTIVKSIYLGLDGNNVRSKEIMSFKIPKDIAPKMVKIEKSLDLAHDFLIHEMDFKSELIPSSNLIRFLTYIFAKNNNNKLSSSQNDALKRYVQYICLENYYSSATDQKMVQNINAMNNILNNNFEFISKKEITKEDILNIDYNDGSSKYNYILNVLFKYAKSLENNTSIPVKTSDSQSSKINIHHIVPKSIVVDGKKVEKIMYGNSLANLAPILELENKKISKKYPSIYVNEFKETNESIEETLKDLYINEKIFVMIDKDINAPTLKGFWEERAKMIANAINAKI